MATLPESNDSNSVDSTTSDDSDTSTSVPLGTDGDLLQHILQELSLSLNSTATGESGKNTDDKQKGGDDSSNALATKDAEEELIDAMITEIEDSETGEEDSEEEGTEKEKIEQEETEETNEGETEEDVDTPAKEKGTNQDEDPEFDIADAFVLSEPSFSNEPEVIGPPLGRTSKRDKKEDRSTAKEDKGPNTTEYTLLPSFQSIWKCSTPKQQPGNADDLNKSLDVSSDEGETEKIQMEPEIGLKSSMSTAKSADVVVHNNADGLAMGPSTLVNEKDLAVQAPQQSSSTIDEQQTATKKPSLPSLTHSSSASGNVPTKTDKQSIGRNHSMPLDLSKSNDSTRKTDVRAVHSEDIETPPPSKNTLSGTEPMMRILMSLKSSGNNGEQDVLAKPAGMSTQTHSANNESTHEEDSAVQLETKEPSHASPPSTASQEQDVTNEAPEALMDQPYLSGEKMEASMASAVDSSVSASIESDNLALSQPVVKLSRRLKNWTGNKKRKKQGNRQRKRKSNLFRSLANYVRSKPTLPVISEDPDQRDDDSGDISVSTDGKDVGLSDVESDGSPQSLKSIESQNDPEQEDGGYVDENSKDVQLESTNSSEKAENAKTILSKLSSGLGKQSVFPQAVDSTVSDVGLTETDSTISTMQVKRNSSAGSMKAEKADGQQDNTPSLQSKQMSCEGSMLHRDPSGAIELDEPKETFEPPQSPTAGNEAQTDVGTELTLEMHKGTVQATNESMLALKTEIEEETDGFCITLKNSASNEELAKRGDETPTRNPRFSPRSRRSKKPVHERIFDFLEKKPTLSYYSNHGSRASMSDQSPKAQRQRRGKGVFSRTSILKTIKGSSHLAQENREAISSQKARISEDRDRPSNEDNDGVNSTIIAPVLESYQSQRLQKAHADFNSAPTFPEIQRWRSVEEKINASLQKAEALANNYGEDIDILLHQTSSRESAYSSMGMSADSGDDISLQESESQTWRTVGMKIDDSLTKVERLATRLGISQQQLVSSE